jgi:hypothetical protein
VLRLPSHNRTQPRHHTTLPTHYNHRHTLYVQRTLASLVGALSSKTRSPQPRLTIIIIIATPAMPQSDHPSTQAHAACLVAACPPSPPPLSHRPSLPPFPPSHPPTQHATAPWPEPLPDRQRPAALRRWGPLDPLDMAWRAGDILGCEAGFPEGGGPQSRESLGHLPLERSTEGRGAEDSEPVEEAMDNGGGRGREWERGCGREFGRRTMTSMIQ